MEFACKMFRSIVDGLPLPKNWRDAPLEDRLLVANLAHEGGIYKDYPDWWWSELLQVERHRVVEHLRIMRQKARSHYNQVAIVPETVYMGARSGGKSQVQEMIRQAYALGQNRPTSHYVLYPSPNGGNRMLPTLYCGLRLIWVRADKTAVKPEAMNAGHLENCLKLLNESHGNVIGRATELLGRMARHFQNQPGIVHMLVELCEAMQSVDVDEMYPIFKVLAAELQQREPQNVEHRQYTYQEDLL